MIEDHMLGEFGENYLPMGNLYIDVFASDAKSKSDTYTRSLNLSNAIADVSYRKGNTK